MRKAVLVALALLALVAVALLWFDGSSWLGVPSDGPETVDDGEGARSLRGAEAPALRGHPPRSHAEPKGAEIDLAPEGALLGRVLDPSGRPLAGAEVYVHYAHHWGTALAGERELRAFLVTEREVRATTDADGRFAIEEAGEGRAWLIAHSEGFGMRATAVVLRGGQIVGGPVDLLLPPGRHLKGRVVDRHGEGVAGVRVAFIGSWGWSATPLDSLGGATVSGADGHYEAWIGRTLNGYASVAFAHPDVACILRRWEDGAGDVLWPSFVEVTLRVMTGDDGAPLGALAFAVGAWDGSGLGAICSAWSVTDEEGRATMPLVAGVLIRFVGRHARVGSLNLHESDIVAVASNKAMVPAGREASLEIRLEVRTAATFVGTVRDAEGRPLAAAQVTCGNAIVTADGEPVHGIRDPISALTDAEGRYALAIPAGRVWFGCLVGVRARGHVPVVAALRTVPEAQRALPRRRDITLRRGARLVGRVLDAAGRPLAGAHVVHADGLGLGFHHSQAPAAGRRLGATTGADGRYTLFGIPRGAEVIVVASHRTGTRDGSVTLRTDQHALQTAPDIRLKEGRSLRVRVLGPGGLVRAGAVVRLAHGTESFKRALDFTFGQGIEEALVAGEDGEVLTGRVAPGGYCLLVMAADTAGVAVPIVIEAGGGPQEVTVRLRRSAPIRGTIVDHKGRPVADVQLSLFHPVDTVVTAPSQWLPHAAAVDEDPRRRHFRVGAVPPGVPVSLHVDAGYYQPFVTTVRGGQAPVKITLIPWDAELLARIEAVESAALALRKRHGPGLDAAMAKDPELAAKVAALEAEATRLQTKHEEVSGGASCGGSGES